MSRSVSEGHPGRPANGYILVSFIGPLITVAVVIIGGSWLLRTNWSAMPFDLQQVVKVAVAVVAVLFFGGTSFMAWKHRGQSRGF